MPGKRQAGWPPLLVTFLLATQEKSDSVAEGDRPLLASNATSRSIAHKCALAGVGDRPFLALNAAKGIARERAPTGAGARKLFTMKAAHAGSNAARLKPPPQTKAQKPC